MADTQRTKCERRAEHFTARTSLRVFSSWNHSPLLNLFSDECGSAKTVVLLFHDDLNSLNIISLSTDTTDVDIPILASI
ncbi:hypothetical protein WMY93_012777 [Mugilogobius chulae]|uniref:Uncharacterized protein n=1 Tax=Mugilogobius chulae TaxID=88201 RepID=A0AAW0P3W3_9GOBI